MKENASADRKGCVTSSGNKNWKKKSLYL